MSSYKILRISKGFVGLNEDRDSVRGSVTPLYSILHAWLIVHNVTRLKLSCYKIVNSKPKMIHDSCIRMQLRDPEKSDSNTSGSSAKTDCNSVVRVRFRENESSIFQSVLITIIKYGLGYFKNFTALEQMISVVGLNKLYGVK